MKAAMDQSKPNILLPEVNAIFTALDLEPCRTVRLRGRCRGLGVAVRAEVTLARLGVAPSPPFQRR